LDVAKEMTFRTAAHGLDVRVVVLVGGRDFGRCPLAAHLPTALWPIGDKPVLARLLDHLARLGFERVAVCCAQEDAEAVGAVCRDAAREVALVVGELAAGTAGCVRDAVAGEPGDLILVLSGSMLAPPALEELIAAHQAGGAELTIVFNPAEDGATALGAPAEIYLCRPEVMHHIPRAGYSDIKEGLIPSLLRADGTVRPVVLDREVGNFHSRAGYLKALEVVFRGRAADGSTETVGRPSGAALGPEAGEADVHPTARICGPVQIGAHARLAEGVVVIGPAVIGQDVVVEAASVVVRSALWAGARVGTRCEIRESIVDRQAVLPDETQMVESAASPSLSGQGPELGRAGVGQGKGGRRREYVKSLVGRLAAWLPERTPRSGSQMAYAVGGVVVLAAFLWSYRPTISELVTVWLRSDEFSSGLLVPFLAAYVLWLRRADLRSTVIRPVLFFGIIAFLVAQAVRAVGLDFYSSAERLSLILSLAALVLLILGWRYLAKTAPVLLFLCLMLPLPARIQGAITLPLQRWSTTSAVFCLELAGYPIQQDGNVIHIGTASVAVAEACNGLRMITAFFVISGLVALLVRRSWWEKGLVLGSSLPIAFICNTLRLAATAVFFTVIKGEVWEQRFHDGGGYAMMPLALALVVGELWLLTRLTTPPTALTQTIIARRQPQHVPDP
jgi:exosortase